MAEEHDLASATNIGMTVENREKLEQAATLLREVLIDYNDIYMLSTQFWGVNIPHDCSSISLNARPQTNPKIGD